MAGWGVSNGYWRNLHGQQREAAGDRMKPLISLPATSPCWAGVVQDTTKPAPIDLAALEAAERAAEDNRGPDIFIVHGTEYGRLYREAMVRHCNGNIRCFAPAWMRKP